MKSKKEQTGKDTLQRKIEKVNWGVFGFLLVAGFFAVSYQFALGIFIGGIISILNFHWLSRDVRKLFQQFEESGEAGKPKRFILLRYFLRLSVTGIVLFAVLAMMPVNVIGLLVGLSTVIISIVIAVILANFKNPLRRFKEKHASLSISI